MRMIGKFELLWVFSNGIERKDDGQSLVFVFLDINIRLGRDQNAFFKMREHLAARQ